MIVKRDKRETEQLKSIITAISGYELAGICENGQDAIKNIMDKNPDIVIMDEVLPGKRRT